MVRRGPEVPLRGGRHRQLVIRRSVVASSDGYVVCE